MAGSSPLARGLPEGTAAHALAERIIPARAGFTAWSRGRSLRRPDHPRSRGVYGQGDDEGCGDRGSSPLARGLPGPRRLKGRQARIIPARAGFTSSPPAAAPLMSDHPRSRGVYAICAASMIAVRGSSPLARGLPRWAGIEDAWIRIIPARAGFTGLMLVVRQPAKDHPRSRGVYEGAHSGFPSRGGSSPLARGLRAHQHRQSTQSPDHPRSRGVYGLRALHGQHLSGSSPLARGLLLASQVNLPDRRIIPARAGFTRVIRVSHWCSPDHPRSRGVYPPIK